jgi:hypothetical protein
VSDVALADDGAARIVKRYAAAVGLDPAVYSGHSLRAGFLTSAAESGASVFKLAEVSRHKSLRRTRSVGRRGAHYGSKWCSRGARHDRRRGTAMRGTGHQRWVSSMRTNCSRSASMPSPVGLAVSGALLAVIATNIGKRYTVRVNF